MIYAILLMLAWTFLWEQAAIRIKKYKEIQPYQKAMVITFFQTLISGLSIYFFAGFEFQINILNIILSLVLIAWVVGFYYFAIKTIEVADRSTSSIFSVLVLPMLLISDLVLWYEINMYQIVWVLFITFILLLSSYNGTLNLKWLKYILTTTGIAFLNTMVFKYTISHGSNVSTMLFIQSIFAMLIAIMVVYKQMWLNWIKAMMKKDYMIIWAIRGTNTMLTSLAYMFGPASIISSFKRMCAMFWWVVFWKLIFHEANLWRKMGNVALLSLWILVMNVPALAANVEWIKKVQTSVLWTDINGNTQVKVEYYVQPNQLETQLKKSDVMVGF